MPYRNREQQLQAQKEHYKKNKNQYLNNQYVRRMERARWYHDYKTTLKCEICGETHPACLQFHHKDPLEKEGEVATMVNSGYSKEIILKEIAKCSVLCANCHLRQHWDERMVEGKVRCSAKYKEERPVE